MTMNTPMSHGPQAGFGALKPILIIVVLISALVVGFKVGPPYYEFYQLKRLADRVVKEMVDLSPKEVKNRVEFEMDRINRSLPREVFMVEQRKEGYKVVIDYSTPILLEVGGKKFPLVGDKEEVEFHYEVGH